jgi:hypothetical protein
MISVIFIGIQLKYEDFDRPFAQSQSDSKIIHFYMYIYRSYLLSVLATESTKNLSLNFL